MAITGTTGGDIEPNYNIVGDNNYRKVFKIPVGNIPDDEIEDYIRKIEKKLKKANRKLDYKIFLPDEDICYFLPINKKNQMKNKPETPDYNKIHDAIYPSKSSYMRIVPNSHFWTDLNQIAHSIDYQIEREKREKVLNEFKDYTSVYVGEPLTKDYILIGLGNSLTRGYILKPYKEVKLTPDIITAFTSIEQMIEYVESERFNLDGLLSLITNTINIGLNLTNGLKMERNEIYKRLDSERDYQDMVGKSGIRGDIPDEEKPVAEWVNYIEYHLSKAKDYVYHLQKDHALEEIRKVAALAVRAMEIHGCPERIMPERIGGIDVKEYLSGKSE
jgi:hypothetical protein